jgi:hypothetical protein
VAKHDDANEISRRDFASRLGGIAAAAVVAGRDLVAAPTADTKPLPARVMGANDRVVLASIGVRGQGDALKRGFARLKNVEIKTLCDIDANLADERINDPKLTDVATFKPRTRTSTASSSRRRTTGMRWPRSGRFRPESTSTSRSPPRTRSGKDARWWTPRRSTTASSRSGQ